MRGITPIRRYLVTYEVEGEKYQDTFSCFCETKPEIEINTELNDKFRDLKRNILKIDRIPTPDEMKIPWMEEYYKNELLYCNNI